MATRLHVIPNGWNENDLAHIVLNPHLGTDINRTPAAEWVKVPIWSVLVEADGVRILFDTASHPQAMSERWPANQRALTPYHCPDDQLLLPSLARLGLSPGDVDIVIASHLHEDHAGGLEFFPDSRIYVQQRELENAMVLYATRPETQMGAYIKRDIARWLEIGLHWAIVPDDGNEVPIAPGVTVLNLGAGHTFGMLGLLVELPGSGSVILVSDAIMSAENYGPPVRLNGFPYDSVGIRNTTERVRRLAAEYDAQVWFGHDMSQFETLRTGLDDWYE